MRLILFLGVVLIFIIGVDSEKVSENIIKCSSVSEDISLSNIMPLRYDVRIVVRPRQRILSGFVNILIDVWKRTNYITLHAAPTHRYEAKQYIKSFICQCQDHRDSFCRYLPIFLPYVPRKITTLDSLSKSEEESAFYKQDLLDRFQYCEKKQVLILNFNKMIDVGKFWLKISYRSVLNKNIEDIIYPTTGTKRNQTWMVTNIYTPKSIRSFFPCWDDPRVNATYNISIQSPADYTVLSNIPEESSLYKEEPLFTQLGTKLTQYKEFISMPTHLIAFLIVDDITMDPEGRGIHYMWHKTDANKKFTYILEKAEMVTSVLTTFMEISPSDISSKINHVVLPNSPMRSMGIPGLIVYRERDITFHEALYSPGRSVIDITTLITYEIMRQLFVSVLSPHTNQSADYIYLNEIFASYYGYYITTKVETANRLTELFVVKIIQPALDSDTLIEREPIIHKIKSNDGIDALLYPLLYHKKAFALIRMLHNFVNREKFKGAIRKYVHERTTDVWTLLEEVHFLKFHSGYSVKEFMNSWLTAKHHPELLIYREYKKWTAVCISLRSYVQGNPEWIIPVNYLTQSNYESYNISEVLWLKWGKVQNINGISNNDFLIVNAELIGYYRVNYDIQNWLLILNFLQKYNFSHISPINRAQLINNAYYFATKNQLDTYIFINITKHLKLDRDFITWYPMFNILSYMTQYFKFPESNRMKEHFLELLGPIMTKLGYETNPWDDAMKQALRHLARKWACKFGHRMCRNAAFQRMLVYLDNDELDEIPEHWRYWILCDGMKLVNLDIWKRFLDKIINKTNTEVFLKYLLCTENSSIIEHYLILIIQTNYFQKIKQSIGLLCRDVIRKHVKNKDVLRFVLNNIDVIMKRFSHDFSLGILLGDIITNVYSFGDLDMIIEYAKKYSWIKIELAPSFNTMITNWRIYLMKVLSKFQMFHDRLYLPHQ